MYMKVYNHFSRTCFIIDNEKCLTIFMLTPNTLLQNRYQIIRELARGGMGAVYEAKDRRLGIRVALKETLFNDEKLSRAFEHEARLLAGLRHPALPIVTDHFNEGEGQFLVMELIEGEDLRTLLEREVSPFSPMQVLDWAYHLLDALDYLHTQQPPIIHRDIKPQNLKLTPKGRLILLDFGLAKGKPLQDTLAGSIKSIYGYTPNYAPVEQITASGTDPRSDIYSLAATLYHLMTGVMPRDSLARAGTVLNKGEDPLQAAHKLNPAVPPAVSDVLSQAMALDIEKRPRTAAILRTMLQEAERGVINQPTLKEIPAIEKGSESRERVWRVGGKTVQGATQKRAHLPNRDAIGWLPESGKGLPLVLAISDGLDNLKNFRGNDGAQIAVNVARESLQDFLSRWPDFKHFSAIKRTAEESLPKTLVRNWEEAVNSHLEKKPISLSHLEALEKRAGRTEREAVEANPLLAYSASLMTVLVTETFIIYFQLGDGEILTVSEAGEVARALSKESGISSKVHPSLSSPDSWKEFRVRFQVLSGLPPSLILLSTDGYAKSFRRDEDFLKAGSDILDLIRSEGFDRVSGYLESWLRESARAGKGDDATLGIISFF
jgi:serine/threonine protein kinase